MFAYSENNSLRFILFVNVRVVTKNMKQMGNICVQSTENTSSGYPCALRVRKYMPRHGGTDSINEIAGTPRIMRLENQIMLFF